MAELALQVMLLPFASCTFPALLHSAGSSSAGEPQGQLEVGFGAVLGQNSSSEGSWTGQMRAM